MRVNIKNILKDSQQRKKLCVEAIKAIQNREDIDTTIEQATIAYDKIQLEKKIGLGE